LRGRAERGSGTCSEPRSTCRRSARSPAGWGRPTRLAPPAGWTRRRSSPRS
jgi:hypothetical protein